MAQTNAPPDNASVAALLQEPTVSAALYYPWGGGYSQLEGRMWRGHGSGGGGEGKGRGKGAGSGSGGEKGDGGRGGEGGGEGGGDGKVRIRGRVSLWGDGDKGTTLGVKPMISRLLSMPRVSSSPDGYSIIPVHVWSHSYADVLTIATALEASGGVDVVLPSELISRLEENVWKATPRCTCDTPAAGKAGRNEYTCSDGDRGFCARTQQCFTSLAFLKGDWRSGCA